MLKANRFLQYWQGLLGGLRKQEKSLSQLSRSGSLKTSMFVIVRLVSALILVGIVSTGAQAKSIPTPKFFGVYALYDGKLTELKRNPQSDTYEMTIGGGDIIHSLSNITFPDSKKLTFIVFSPSVANLTRNKFFVNIMATIRNSPPPSYHMVNRGWEFRVAPVPNQPQMVQLIGPEQGTSGGYLALMLDDGFYDYKITNSPPDKEDSCVERLVSFMGPSYQPCGKGFTDNGNGTITDKDTGLMWQKGENAAEFNWYQASGTYDEKFNSSTQNVCGSLSLAGGGWRLPTLTELQSLVEESLKPTINTTYFPNVHANSYWSSTTYANNTDYAWIVDFDYGYVGYHFFYKDYSSYVRCVRSGQ